MANKIFIQIFGFGAMIFLYLIYQQKSREKLIIYKLCADLCWVFHYFLLSAYGGMIPNLVGIFREIVFVNRDSKKWAGKVFWPVFFILINWTLGFFSFNSYINFLPISASTFVTVSLWCRNPKFTKIISIPVSITFLIYDIFVCSFMGVINESIGLLSIFIYFLNKEKNKMSTNNISSDLKQNFMPDFFTSKKPKITEDGVIKENKAIISDNVPDEVKKIGKEFADEISDNFISDFKKSGDLMVHVSSYAVIDGIIYMTYYANTKTKDEDPHYHTARLVYCPANDTDNKTYIDLQSAKDDCYGKKVEAVYDTILMHKDEDTLYLMWTANLSGDYYRLYRTYTISSKKLSDVKINKFKVDSICADWNIHNMQAVFAEKEIEYKKMYTDIGIMQKISAREENGVIYYYTGAYCGDFNCIIKSRDLEEWEYVAQPDFLNQSKWENAVYVYDDKCFYFVRQQNESPYGFLTYFDLNKKTWETPVLISDCQSRSDFIMYKDNLYLFHAPIDREHIGVVHIDTEKIENSKEILQAHMKESCFYPFIQYGKDQLYMSYTSNRMHINLSKFNAEKYLNINL